MNTRRGGVGKPHKITHKNLPKVKPVFHGGAGGGSSRYSFWANRLERKKEIEKKLKSILNELIPVRTAPTT